MKKIRFVIPTLVMALAMVVCSVSPVMAVEQGGGGGFVNGGGTISTPDGACEFGGTAMSVKSGEVNGRWSHVDASGDVVVGEVEYLLLRRISGEPPSPPEAYPNQAYFGGEAELNGQSGYWFDVVVEDHGEPGTSDTYHFTLRELDGTGSILDVQGTLSSGNIQIHPPNSGHPY